MTYEKTKKLKRSLLMNFIFFLIPFILIFIAFTLEIDPFIAIFIYIGLSALIIYYGYRCYRTYLSLRRK